MLYQDYTAKLLEMEDVIVDDVTHTATTVEIALHQKPRNCSCPVCRSTERTIHDYRIQRIRDVPIIGKQTTLILRKRRYKCKQCGKRFIEPVDFLPRYRRITNRVFGVIADKLAGVCSFTDVAKEIGISVSTVIRLFDLVQYPKPDVLPQTIAIDEFKGNTGSEKYQCIITDVENNIVLDILPNRYEEALAQYLRSCDRSGVRIFVSDMWHPFTRVAGALFPHAIQLVDKYHYIRQAIWAFEAVRKQEQKKFSATHRRYFKKSKRLLTARYSRLSLEQQQQVNVMLYASAELSSAHFLKEKFFEMLDEANVEIKKKLFSEWILMAQDSRIPQFDQCAGTYLRWSVGILNTFEFPYTNGFTEGCNNKIKVLKRNAYGYRNFTRFRNRILHMFAYQRRRAKQEAVA